MYFAENKERWKRNETNSDEKNECLNISFMHNHTLHDTLHQIYVFLSKIGIQVESGLALDKKLQKDLRKKEGNSDKSEFFKEYQQVWHKRCKSNQVNISDKVKAQSNWHSKVSLGK